MSAGPARARADAAGGSPQLAASPVVLGLARLNARLGVASRGPPERSLGQDVGNRHRRWRLFLQG
jgi:hypothetical protein